MTYTQHPDDRHSRASCDHLEGDNILSNLNLNELSRLYRKSHSLSGTCFSPSPVVSSPVAIEPVCDSDAASLNLKAVD